MTNTTTYRSVHTDRLRVEFIEVRDNGRSYAIQGPTASNLVSAVKAIARDGRTAHVIDRSSGNLVLARRNGVWTGRNSQVVTEVGSVRGPRLIDDLVVEVTK